MFIHLLIDTYLGYFQFRNITNNASVNIHIQAFAWKYAFMFLE